MIDVEIVTRCKDCAEHEQMQDQLYCGKSGCFVKHDHFCGDGYPADNDGKEVTEADILNAIRMKYNIRCERCKYTQKDNLRCGGHFCKMHKTLVTGFFFCLDYEPREGK